MQKLVFITGKGGVGKSTYAASLAHKYSKSGQKTLLVELGDDSFFARFLKVNPVIYQPKSTPFGFDVALWSGTECLKEYALYLLKSEAIYRLFFENKVSRSLINIAPGLSELSILGKITAGPRRHGPAPKHDVIIVDGFATGHFMALLRAPKGMAEAISFGPMGEQSRGIHKTLVDRSISEYHIVTLPEELPIAETLEMSQKLTSEFNISPQIVINKWWNTKIKSNELPNNNDYFSKLLKAQILRQDDCLRRLSGVSHQIISFPQVFSSDASELILNTQTQVLL